MIPALIANAKTLPPVERSQELNATKLSDLPKQAV
jgi:hypothetical protein